MVTVVQLFVQELSSPITATDSPEGHFTPCCARSWSELGWVDPNALTAEFKGPDPAHVIGDLLDKGDVPADYDRVAVRQSNCLHGVQLPV